MSTYLTQEKTNNSSVNGERVTRGAFNRRPTEKYALFQQSKQSLTIKQNKKNTTESQDMEVDKKAISSSSNEPEENDDDEYILQLCKQQSFKNQDEADEIIETANSTPEKPEKSNNYKNENEKSRQTLEFEDLDNILDQEEGRFMKSKQLAIQEQRSSSAKQANLVQQNSLMPKRIMSSKTKIMKKSTEPKEQPVKKAPKDRSALIGLKRTRKSRDQIYQLQRLYEDSKGKPTKAELKNLARETGLKLQQVYKWYWDTEKKNDKLQKELKNNDPSVQSPLRISRKILKTQYTDEFGGYSKTWFTDGLQEMKNQQNGEEDFDVEDGQDNFDELDNQNQIDNGMDGLAKSLGLDIEAIALELALNDSTPPTQCLPVRIDEEPEEKLACLKEEQMKKTNELKDYNQSAQLEKVRNYVLMKAKATQYSPTIKTKGTQCSPIINPIVIRPNCQNNNTFYSPSAISNASASNVSSIISKASKAQPKPSSNNPFTPIFPARNQQGTSGGDNFNQDKIHQAFQNLFGGSFGGSNNASASIMQTPQFNDNKYQIKTKPKYNILDTPGNFLNNKPNANARSVFSPIPCKPQSECSILGVRGDRNTPYTPFNRNESYTPRISPVVGANSRKAENVKQGNNGQKQEITPGQFLRTAQPVSQPNNTDSLFKSTPKNPTNVYNLYQGPNPAAGCDTQSPFVTKQTPKQFRMQAQSAFIGQTASPPKHQTIINFYTQPVSCSNFYQSGPGNNSFADRQSASAQSQNENACVESNSSFSRNVSPTPCKTII